MTVTPVRSWFQSTNNLLTLLWVLMKSDDKEQGAGDQGLMFGYACNETDVLMPAPIAFAHQLVKRQAEVRKDGTLAWLRPDAKSQVTFKYEDGVPVSVLTRLYSRLNTIQKSNKKSCRKL